MKRLVLSVGVCALVTMTGGAASASTVTFNLGTQLISASAGDNIPTSGSLPSVGLVTFEDIAAQTVKLTITAGLEAANEYFAFLLFSGTTGSDATHPRPQDLLFTQGATTGTFSAPAVVSGENAMTVNPNGGFDYKVTFGTNTAANRFDGTDSIIYTITCSQAASCGAAGYNPLDALDFNVINAVDANPNYNGWYAMASLGYLAPGGTGDNNGARYGDQTGADNQAGVAGLGATAVPEPASVLLLGSGLAALAAWKRRSLRRKS